MQTNTDTFAEAASVTGEPEKSATPPIKWNLFTRISFRFAFAYFIPFSLPFLLQLATPFFYYPSAKYQAMWDRIIPWAGKHVLHIAYSFSTDRTGSGDKTADYIQIFCLLILAMVVTVVWSLLDRKRTNYIKLNRWMRICVRLALALTLLEYGAMKVFPVQFSAPGLRILFEPYGESSPMALLWTFMGASKSYTFFAGAVEMAGGLLLLFPQLTTLGALIGILAMGNVFILNMSYDVPVKLYTFHYLAMGILLLLPDLRRLIDLFIFHRAIQLRTEGSLFRRRWLNVGFVALQLVLGAVALGSSLYGAHQQVKSYSKHLPQVYGIWAVDEFSADGEIRPSLLADELLWQRLVFEYSTYMTFQYKNGKWQGYRLQLDTQKKTLLLTNFNDPKWNSELTFDKPAEDTMTLDGQFDGKKIHAKLHREDEKKMLLMSRGFHWISETPFNR